MRRFLAVSLLVLVAGLMPSSSTRAADDWSFVNGNYALDPDDCKLVGSTAAFSKELVDGLSQEVMTREGITSPREVHCKFRSAEKSDTGWKVQADCEEAGKASPADIAVTTSSDGTVSILSEDVYGPEALKFTPCQK
jgi:hypothetical protein